MPSGTIARLFSTMCQTIVVIIRKYNCSASSMPCFAVLSFSGITTIHSRIPACVLLLVTSSTRLRSSIQTQLTSLAPDSSRLSAAQTGFTAQPCIHAERQLIASSFAVGDDIMLCSQVQVLQCLLRISHTSFRQLQQSALELNMPEEALRFTLCTRRIWPGSARLRISAAVRKYRAGAASILAGPLENIGKQRSRLAAFTRRRVAAQTGVKIDGLYGEDQLPLMSCRKLAKDRADTVRSARCMCTMNFSF